eukprot:TRINITY_DN833_c0_g1_i2.p1 TRINITY_DN833_c0_g1~~TRINITY_DN833_c0_g1_i2.p1  ORF type:complete len:2153 (+),score=610.32 TRINITY_DN833_c0_g1_i2:69-6527(+)
MGRRKRPSAIQKPRRVLRHLTAAALKEIASRDLSTAKYPLYIDFSPEWFNLTTIRGLSWVNPVCLKELNLNGNQLVSLEIDFLKFPNLKRLFVASNGLVSVHLTGFKFAKMDTIDLSDNRLETVPDLSGFPNLQTLNLSDNCLSGSLSGILSCRRLIGLYLGGNDFMWSEGEFVENLGHLSKMKQLRELITEKNPFVPILAERYRPIVGKILPKLRRLDGEVITKYERAENIGEIAHPDLHDVMRVVSMDSFRDGSQLDEGSETGPKQKTSKLKHRGSHSMSVSPTTRSHVSTPSSVSAASSESGDSEQFLMGEFGKIIQEDSIENEDEMDEEDEDDDDTLGVYDDDDTMDDFDARSYTDSQSITDVESVASMDTDSGTPLSMASTSMGSMSNILKRGAAAKMHKLSSKRESKQKKEKEFSKEKPAGPPKFTDIQTVTEMCFDAFDKLDEQLTRVEDMLLRRSMFSMLQPEKDLSMNETQSLKEFIGNLESLLSNLPSRRTSAVLRVLVTTLLVNNTVVIDYTLRRMKKLLEFSSPYRDTLLVVIRSMLFPYVKQITLDDMFALEQKISGEVLQKEGKGKLLIEVVGARNLIEKDSNGLSDPYVVIKFETIERRTKVFSHSLNPKWTEEFVLNVVDPNSTILIEVFDHDDLSEDDFMGQILLTPAETRGKELEGWFPLQRHRTMESSRKRPSFGLGDEEERVSGDVYLKVQYKEHRGETDTPKSHILFLLKELIVQPELSYLLDPMLPFVVMKLFSIEISPDLDKKKFVLKKVNDEFVEVCVDEGQVLDNVLTILSRLTNDEDHFSVISRADVVERIVLLIEYEQSRGNWITSERYHSLMTIMINLCHFNATLSHNFIDFGLLDTLMGHFESVFGGRPVNWPSLSENQNKGFALLISGLAILCRSAEKSVESSITMSIGERAVEILLRPDVHPIVMSECARAVLDLLKLGFSKNVRILKSDFFELVKSRVDELLSLVSSSGILSLCSRMGLEVKELVLVQDESLFSTVMRLIEIVRFLCDKGVFDDDSLSLAISMISLLDVGDDMVRLSALRVVRRLGPENMDMTLVQGIVNFVFNCNWATKGRTEELLGIILDIILNVYIIHFGKKGDGGRTELLKKMKERMTRKQNIKKQHALVESDEREEDDDDDHVEEQDRKSKEASLEEEKILEEMIHHWEQEEDSPYRLYLGGVCSGLVVKILDILKLNLERDTRGDEKETREKTILSHAAMKLLLFFSTVEEGISSLHSESCKKFLAPIMMLEERYGNEKDVIAIEWSALADDVPTILSCLPNLRPRGNAYVRMFLRLANLIEDSDRGEVHANAFMEHGGCEEMFSCLRLCTNDFGSSSAVENGTGSDSENLKEVIHVDVNERASFLTLEEISLLLMAYNGEAVLQENDSGSAAVQGGHFRSRNILKSVKEEIIEEVDGDKKTSDDILREKAAHFGLAAEWKRIGEKERRYIEMELRRRELAEDSGFNVEWVTLNPIAFHHRGFGSFDFQRNSKYSGRTKEEVINLSLFGNELESLEWQYEDLLERADIVSKGSNVGEDADSLQSHRDLRFLYYMENRAALPQGPAIAACLRCILAILRCKGKARVAMLKETRTERFFGLLGRLGETASWCAYDIGSLILLVMETILKMRLTDGYQDASMLILYDLSAQILHNISLYFNQRLLSPIGLHQREEMFAVHYCRVWEMFYQQLLHIHYFDKEEYDEHTLEHEKLVVRDLCVESVLYNLLTKDDISAVIRLLFHQFTERGTKVKSSTDVRRRRSVLDWDRLGITKSQKKEIAVGESGGGENESEEDHGSAREDRKDSLDGSKRAKHGRKSGLLSKEAEVVDIDFYDLLDENICGEIDSVMHFPDRGGDSYQVAINENIRRSDLVRESVANSLGILLSLLDRQNQFDIIEILNRLLTEEGVSVRASFLQEILSRVAHSRYEIAVEKLLKQQYAMVPEERVLMATWFFRLDAKLALSDTLLILGNRRMFLMRKAVSLNCTVCPPEKFCPEAPKIMNTFRYEDIKCIEPMYGNQKFSFTIGNDDENALMKMIGKLKSPRLSFSLTDVRKCTVFLDLLIALCPNAGDIKMDERTLPSMRQQMMSEKEKVLFFSQIIKHNKRGRKQDRVLVITDEAVYNFAENTTLLFDISKNKKILKLLSFYL